MLLYAVPKKGQRLQRPWLQHGTCVRTSYRIILCVYICWLLKKGPCLWKILIQNTNCIDWHIIFVVFKQVKVNPCLQQIATSSSSIVCWLVTNSGQPSLQHLSQIVLSLGVPFVSMSTLWYCHCVTSLVCSVVISEGVYPALCSSFARTSRLYVCS